MSELQKQIIEEMAVKPEIDPKEEIRKSVDLMKDYLKKHDFLKTLVLGISGGQDSSLLGKLAQIAMEELREETGNEEYAFIAMRLPYGEQADEEEAMAAIDWMKPDKVVRVDIKPTVDASEASIKAGGMEISDFNKGNIKARERMVIQYAVAAHHNGAVLGTDHSAESVTGFFTKFGDGGTDLNPLFRLSKGQGKALLKELNAPTKFYEKTPTADLESDRPGRSDEDALGVTYEEIDQYLAGKEVSEQAAQTIENWYLKTQHKRHLPVTIFDDFWR
ncbi:ammonia-dependent NAD(+) synthetase [Marinilactibacillus psychrotolerans]|uniref:NH(3)-dependent NAD(+) synthetase n=2 Tax=Marinilactibacillus psychrotolerans TaxID=191770 RepID=A0A5R9C3Y0_9LACT|nr:ammonia-dependent NAD(+) synthetase [Marinilactibacillus psychrotolerans]TLQ07471.1 ammonia-dependent NAD(+) synthetase [Marinilactibacillus psychrotolerans]GEQ32862.1 NAD synthetase [Marinilactibacillus psychrotolerans]SJN46128.1 NAD synthetase [Marinilactibacillus psychrotolerans 42ea]